MPTPHQTTSRSACSIDDFFQLACENHGAPVLLLNPENGAIIRSNQTSCELLGNSRLELETKRLSDILAPNNAQDWRAGAHPPDALEKSPWRGTGSKPLLIEIAFQRMALADADVLFCVLRDVTEFSRIRREMEELENIRRQMEVVADERTRQLNEVMEQLKEETARRRLIEENVTTLRENLENQERERVARDIHDGIGQTLQAIKLQLKIRQARCKAGEACDGNALNDVIAEITSASTELREIILALRPLFLEETNLDVAVRSLCDRMAKRANLELRCECRGVFRGLGPSFKLSVFRICQEALANIVKHSGARSAMIRLERDTRLLRIIIRDDGAGGVACPTVISRQGSGLTIMRERVELLNGSFSVISPPGMGTVITVEAPLP